MNNQQLLIIAAAFFTITPVSYAAETLITFDDVSGRGLITGIQNGYKDLNWINFQTARPFDSTSYSGWSNSGAGNGIVSLDYVAINGSGEPAEIQSPTPFTLNSAYFAGIWNDGLQITVKGELGGIIVDTKSFVVDTTGSTLETFNWQNIDTVLISSSGGTHNNLLPHSGTSFAMDNLIINGPVSPAPEPETYAMLLAGLGLLGFMVRRRKTS